MMDVNFQPVRKPCTWTLHAITSICGGLQVVWSVVLSNGSAYLLSLGMPGYITAITWMAGPLCGTLIQPYMGNLSDRWEGRYGRRRPFIVLGAAGTFLSIVLLAFVEQIVSSLNHFLDDSSRRFAVCTAAFFLVWCLSFWIQPLQVGARALIVDLFSKDQQSRASVSASYWVGCGNLIGAASGFVPLPETFGLVGWTQFQCLCLIATFALSFTVIAGCLLGSETPRHLEIIRLWRPPPRQTQFIESIRATLKRMNNVMCQVMLIQFFSWMAWFPFLYYGTSYISSLCGFTHHAYIKDKVDGKPVAHQDLLSVDRLSYHAIRETATRYGTLSFFCFSCSMLSTSAILHACSFQRQRDIVKVWGAAQTLYAFTLMSTLFISTWRPSLIFAFYVGISFSVAQFAPFAILGQECASIRQSNGGSLETGMVMALHNVAISFVQIISAGICALVLIAFKRWGLDGSTAFVIRIGAIPALAAAWHLRKLHGTILK